MMLNSFTLLLFLGIICPFLGRVAAESSNIKEKVPHGVAKLHAEFTKILLQSQLTSDENGIFSPLSIYTALAQLHLGSTGTTRNELSSFLGFSNETERLAETHQSFGSLLRDIQNTTKAEVNVANRVFLQKELKLKQDYSTKTKDYYNSEAESTDFASNPSQATATINKWVSDNTRNRIPKIFEKDVPSNTQILLASALYFNGKWANSFPYYTTSPATFHTPNGQINVETMSNTDDLGYLSNDDLQYEVISIPFSLHEFSMEIFLPYSNNSLKSVVNALTSEQHKQTIDSLRTTHVKYLIPRLKFRWSRQINEHLTKLGLKQIFQTAQLDNMIDNIAAVSDVTHAAEIDVNEKGATASVVTMIGAVGSSGPGPIRKKVIFHANRPFLFTISHKKTATILFTGVVQNPANIS